MNSWIYICKPNAVASSNKESNVTFKAKTLVLGATMVGLMACQSTSTTVTSGQNSPDINQVKQQAYNGPKARIAVARFTDKSNNHHWYSKEIGNGMSDQLTTSLVNTNRFIVLERSALDTVLSEQDLVTSGRVNADTGAGYGAIEGAEIVIVASVTEFDDGNSGGSIGGSGMLGSVFSSVKAGFSSSHMAIDIRLIDTTTSRILAATSVESGTKDFDLTGALYNIGDSFSSGALSGWSNTPKEKALREVIEKAVQFILTKVPEDFYRYNANNTLAAGKTAPKFVAKVKSNAPSSSTLTSNVDDDVVDSRSTSAMSLDSVKIAMAQAQLNCLGYLSDQEKEGKLTPNTVKALKKFQKDSGLTVNGELNKTTNNALADTGCMNNTVGGAFSMIANAFVGAEKTSDEEYARVDDNDFLLMPMREENERGKFAISHTDSESGMTEIEVIAKHAESGVALKKAHATLFKVNSSGNLADEPDYLRHDVVEPVNSGRYYLKVASHQKFFASGDVILKRGVKNVITATLN